MLRLRIKPVAALSKFDSEKRLPRQLGAPDLLLLGCGSTIGTGIFVLTGIGAAHYAGPALIISFVIGAFACCCAALMYAELAALAPVAGSAYTYTHATLGEAAAWIVGWSLILEYSLAGSAVAAGWSAYFSGILLSAGLALPVAWSKVPAQGGIVDIPAIGICLFVTFMLVRGTRAGVRLNATLVAIKLAVIFAFLFIAVPHIDPHLWSPFMPFGFKGVSAGAALIVFAYLGFDAVSTAAEEARNPARDVPIGLIGSLVICATLYIAVTATLTGVARYSDLDTAEPLAFVLRNLGFRWGSALVATGALCGITTVLLVLIYGQTRVLYAISRDKLLPEPLSTLHPRYRTPHVATWITGVACSVFSGFVPLSDIAAMANIGTLFAFVMVAAGVMILRRTQPDLPRPFRVPAGILVGALAIASCGFLMFNLPSTAWLRFLVWTLAGMLVYGLYGYRRSPLHPANDPI